MQVHVDGVQYEVKYNSQIRNLIYTLKLKGHTNQDRPIQIKRLYNIHNKPMPDNLQIRGDLDLHTDIEQDKDVLTIEDCLI